MRPDQIARLRELQEKLAEIVLEEADPDNWSGAGTPMDQLSRDERGNRYWEKKNAAATFALLERTTSTLSYSPADGEPAAQEVDIEKQIAKREREAQALLDGVMKKARKTAFDERAIGKK
jgi:hypothetical protein